MGGIPNLLEKTHVNVKWSANDQVVKHPSPRGELFGAILAEWWAQSGGTLVPIAAINGHICIAATWLNNLQTQGQQYSSNSSNSSSSVHGQYQGVEMIYDICVILISRFCQSYSTWVSFLRSLQLRYRVTSHVQGLKGGAVLNGTLARAKCVSVIGSPVDISWPCAIWGAKSRCQMVI